LNRDAHHEDRDLAGGFPSSIRGSEMRFAWRLRRIAERRRPEITPSLARSRGHFVREEAGAWRASIAVTWSISSDW